MGAHIQKSNSSSSQVILSEINVTPLVDVMLVLLIMFMVTAPLLQQGIDIEIPKTKSTGLELKEEPLRIIIDVKKTIIINQQKITYEALGRKLKNLLLDKTNKQVFIEADRRIDYGFVAQIMAEVKASGATSLGLITLPEP